MLSLRKYTHSEVFKRIGPWDHSHCLLLLICHYLLIYVSGNAKSDTRANLKQFILFLLQSYTHLPLLTLLGITLPLPTGRVPTSHSALLAQDLATGKYLMRSRLQMNRGENILVAYSKDRKEGKIRDSLNQLLLVLSGKKALLQTDNPTEETLNRYVENRRT